MPMSLIEKKDSVPLIDSEEITRVGSPTAIPKTQRSGSNTSSSGVFTTSSTPDEHQELSGSPGDHDISPQEAYEQLAIELSMIVLQEPNMADIPASQQNFSAFGSKNADLASIVGAPIHRSDAFSGFHHHPQFIMDSDSGASSGGENSIEEVPTFGSSGTSGFGGSIIGIGDQYSVGAGDWPLRRVSLNVTENVPVPSSEHVAEIVGRQGCKIKALRAKTNTYIKTPVRGEDAVFVVTGRREDVELAKQEILSAADHFTQIRASRRHSQGGAPAPGHITAYVRVPYRVVGLVVGPKGATIKRIQQDTHTYIITPSRDREPIFEVTGLPDNVETARREIETHIYTRTGNLPISSGYDASFYAASGMTGGTATPVASNGSQHAEFHSQTAAAAAGIARPAANGAAAATYGACAVRGNNDFHLNGCDAAFFGETTQLQNPVISKPAISPPISGGLGNGGCGESTWGSSLFPTAGVSSNYPIWSTGGLEGERGTASIG